MISGIYSGISIYPLFYETDLVSTSNLLDYQQRVYTHQLLYFPNIDFNQKILLISLREGDREFLGGKLLENTCM